jgi:hypothetical protein
MVASMEEKVMNRTIWKFQVEFSNDPFDVVVPSSEARLVHFAIQDDKPTLWFILDRDAAGETLYTYHIAGTGHDIPDGFLHEMTTVAPPFVWHLMYKDHIYNG